MPSADAIIPHDEMKPVYADQLDAVAEALGGEIVVAVAELDDDEPQNVIEQDGYRIDADTGEILGLVKVSERFVPDTPDKVDWVLERMQEEDAQIAMIDQRLAAISSNLLAMRREHERRRTYMAGRFDADLRAFAETQLLDGKTRTYRTPFGSLSFRRTAGSIKVVDELAAIEWCREPVPCPVCQGASEDVDHCNRCNGCGYVYRCVDAIKVKESIIVTPLKPLADELPSHVFTVTGPGETFKVDTSVGGSR